MRHVLIGALIVFGVSSAPLLAQSMTAGSEFQINSQTLYTQILPSVATDLFGNFVVVWQSDVQDGDDFGIFGQRFLSSGVPSGVEFQVNTYTAGAQVGPSVAMDARGDFVVVWNSYGQDGGGGGIFGQRFDTMGVKQGAEIQINTFTTGAQLHSKVATDGVGNFVVVWDSYYQDGYGVGVFGQRFDTMGVKQGAEFQVNTHTTYDQSYPSIAADPAGNFAVVWQSYGQDGSGNGIFGQRFLNSGARRGAEFQVNSSSADEQVHPSVAVAAAGDFVGVWAGTSNGIDHGFLGRHFSRAGVAQGLEFQVRDFTADDLQGPVLTADASGNFLVAWAIPALDGDGFGVSAQQFNSSGLKRGPEFPVNTFTTEDQTNPAVTMDRKGNFVVAWQSYGQDGDHSGVFGQRFTCTDVDGDGICDLQDVILTAPAAMATLDCHTPLTGRPTIQWDKGDFDRFRVFVGTDPNFPVGTRVSSGDTLLARNSYLVPTKKWTSACKKAIAANALSPTLFIEVFGVNVNVPKSASNRKTFSQVVRVSVTP